MSNLPLEIIWNIPLNLRTETPHSVILLSSLLIHTDSNNILLSTVKLKTGIIIGLWSIY